jgi:chromate transporter
VSHLQIAWALFVRLLFLSLIAIGGVITVVPDIQRYVVDTQHWMTATQFADAFALGQVSPGPNMMYITLVGWTIAGWMGAVAATAGMVLPPVLLTLIVARARSFSPQAKLGRAIRSGLAPITLGLMLASGWILVTSVDHRWPGYVATVLTVIVVLRTKWNPLWLIAAGAVAGVIGLI